MVRWVEQKWQIVNNEHMVNMKMQTESEYKNRKVDNWETVAFVLFLFSLIDFEDIIVTVSYLIKQNKDAELHMLHP